MKKGKCKMIKLTNIIKRKRRTILKTLGAMICTTTLAAGIYFSSTYTLSTPETANEVQTIAYYSTKLGTNNSALREYYLSDMEPIEKRVGWRELGVDADTDGNPLVLTIENSLFSFKKGLFAHANSTLVYDLTDYDDYSYFVTFIGLNNTSTRGDGVTYHFYTSENRTDWNEVVDPIVKLPKEEATYVQIPLNGTKYLKLVADANAANAADHSVYADAKLVNDVNGNFVLDSVEDLDAQITNLYTGQTELDGELEHLILKRQLVQSVGKYTLNSFYNENEDNKAAIDWLLGNKKVLNYYILGGTPLGNSYYNSLTQLARLYKEYNPDFTIQETTQYGTVLGDLYLRMAIALSLTHSTKVGLWMDNANSTYSKSDAVRRYAIVKYMHKNSLFTIPGMDYSTWFEKYTVEEMRYVMANNIDDESMLWLNAYVRELIEKEGSARLWPHRYVSYVWPNYANPVYYAEENIEYFNDLFSVKDPNNEGQRIGLWDVVYTVPGGVNTPEYKLQIPRGTADNKIYKVWMNMRNKFGTGAVCGGISKVGSNIRGVLGLPDAVVGQPGHAAHINYFKNSNGEGFWGIDNDVSGWAYTGSSILLGWSSGPWASGYTGTYIPLAQEVINHNDTYEQTQKLVYLANSYTDLNKKEELYRKALAIQPLNLNAWYGLITTYNASTTKKEEQYYKLAEEIAEALKYYPLPMYQMTNLIKPKLTSVEYSYLFTLLQTRILKEASVTPNTSTEVLQPGITRLMGNYLLGQMDSSIATFSFDGFNAGKIVLSSRFDGNGVRWDYSLDGKTTWNEVSFSIDEEHKLQLTAEEISKITSANDIYIHIVGVNYDEENLFKIDITEGSLPAELFANDLENRIVGVTLNTEWRYTEEDSWTSYNVASPDLTGNKTVQVREAATGTALPSAVSEMFTFTEDNQPNTRKYIPVSHLSIHQVSTEAVNQGGAATKAIDGNYNTRWHSAWNGTDSERYIVIKLDKPVNLSAVEFVPAGGGNGKIYDGTIYGSLDGENWEELSSMKNITYTNQANTIRDAIANTKSFEIEDVKEVQYVKIVADRTNGNWFTAREFNLYQDISKNPHPTAGIAYSTTDPTNGKVIARLINPSTQITITNNGGSDTYIFEENGEFTFEFVDELGTTGSAVATVTWIDKDIPDANVDYNLDSNHKISISLEDITEDVYLLDKNNKPINFVEVKNKKVTNVSYLDSKENIYKTVEVDENGCITKIIYINNSNNVPSVATYVTTITDGLVSSEEYYDAEGNSLTVTDAEKELLKSLQQPLTDPLEYTFEQSGDYEFKLLDKANNIAYKSIKVDYNNDNSIIVSDISYDITRKTNKDVVATIRPYVFNAKGEKTDAQIISGSSTYRFEDNGKFTFEYKDKNNSDENDIKEHVAEVNWIDKVAPTAQIRYTEKTNGNVVATLVNESEEIIITNNGSNKEYVFTKNGEFTFEFEDMAGNKGSATAHVDSINENPKPIDPAPVEPEIPEDPSTPENPTEPDPVNPSTPNEPVKPVIPYNPNKPNNGNNINNKPDDEPDDSNNTKPDDENNKPDDNKNDTKPGSEDKKPVEDETDKKDKFDKKMIIATLVLIIAIGSIPLLVYLKNKKEQ